MEIINLKYKFKPIHIILFFTCIISFSYILRLVISLRGGHHYDLDYYIDWSNGLWQNGIFSAYSTIESLDYPPLFLFPLYIVGFIRNLPFINQFPELEIIILKMWQVIFDVATIILIYIVLKKYNQVLTIILSCTWALNPTIILNSSFWGQTDSIMIFLILLSFYFLESDKPIHSLVIYALAGLCKYQSLYFAPIILILLFKNYKIQKSLIAFGSSILTGIIIFLPFMINSGIFLPLKVYFGGHSKYPFATLNAFNFYYMLGLNGVNDINGNIIGISISIISSLVIFITLAGILYLSIKSKNCCPYILSFIFMQTIFMFTSRMHERYQILVIIFLLIACLKHKSIKLFCSYIIVTIITFLNHFIVYETFNASPYTFINSNFNTLGVIVSIINIIVYFITLFISIKILDINLNYKIKKSNLNQSGD